MKGTMVYQRQRKKAPKPKATTIFLRFLFVLLIAAAAFWVAGVLMDQFDLLQLVRSNPIEISQINFSSADVPKWVVQLILAAVIFFVVQPLLVILLDLARPRRGEGVGQDYQDQWRRH